MKCRTGLLAERIVSADRRIECRYEDLCTAPQETMIRLGKFANHSEAKAIAALAYHAAAGANQKTRFEKVAVVEHHMRLIEAIAQYGMLAYGYQPSGWHDHPLVWENPLGLFKAMFRDIVKRVSKRLRGK